MDDSHTILLDPAQPDLEATVQAMVEIHISCSEIDGTIATFLPPWDRAKMVNWYLRLSKEITEGRRAIILQYQEELEGDRQLAGFVMLAMPWTETGPFRASVEKLLVSPNFRKRYVLHLSTPLPDSPLEVCTVVVETDATAFS